MTDSTLKPISNVTINFIDGTKAELQNYALVGSDDASWFNILRSPAQTTSKIKMNNMLVEMSNDLLLAIEKEF